MMIFSLLIYNYYSASVVSARLSEPLEKINDSLNELGKLEDVKLGAEWTFYFNSYIKVSNFLLRYQIWTLKKFHLKSLQENFYSNFLMAK